MNKKSIILNIMLFLSGMIFCQTTQTIKLIVPNKTDVVYITGNQESLGNWNPKAKEMKKISAYERSITIPLTYPAEFKFTKGSWDSEGIIHQLDNNPNSILLNSQSKNIFTIKGWVNDADGIISGIDYSTKFLPSNHVVNGRYIRIALPRNYDPKKKYPVFYITDGDSRNFDVAKSNLENFAEVPHNLIPQTILVGIVHKKDKNKFTRRSDLNTSYGKTGQQFKDFIFNELVPHINKNYSTSGFNVMIGHSNGAEYNHFLLLEENNPFRGFISISTNFYGKQVQKEMGEFIKKYNGKPIYYYVANGNYDVKERVEAGNTYEKIYKKSENAAFKFKKQLHHGHHNSMIPDAIYNGIRFMYQDYLNLDNYKNISEFKNKHKKDIKLNYGVGIKYSLYEGEILKNYIVNNNKPEELKTYWDWAKENKLWQNSVMKEPGGFDEMNRALSHYQLEDYLQSANLFEQALKKLNITVEPLVYFGNFPKVIDNFQKIKKYNKLMTILLQSKDYVLEHTEQLGKRYGKYKLLQINYEIARLSSEHSILKREGKKAKQYCIDNYFKNKLFNLDEIKQLSI